MNDLLTYFRAGLDVGSTTAKIAVLDTDNSILYCDYQRHNTKIHETVAQLFLKAAEKIGNRKVSIKVTGSAGIGISEKLQIPFIQEVVASTEVVKQQYSAVKTLIDLGGEDAKMIFFNENRPPDIRMNGSCAGGTGAFIDQMATLLNVPLQELNNLAALYKTIYPIASRCGVFAKTDVQNLISRKIPKEDIAASVFHAVAIQILNTLSRGFDIEQKVMFCGGPFTFLPELIKSFQKVLNLENQHLIIPTNPELLPAIGAAIDKTTSPYLITLQELSNKLQQIDMSKIVLKNRLQPLFASSEEYESWKLNRVKTKVKQVSIKDYHDEECFLGIDSGSTTTKIAVIGKKHELLFQYYANNNGAPIEALKKGLQNFLDFQEKNNCRLKITYSTVTGYGEDLIKAAFGIDVGIVETIAHFIAAKHFNKNVSFIMDIGGQDMKAIFINNGIISRIELNESCSSGCGSFIQTFGNSLGYEVSQFAEMACHATAPSDLGTRCTVFMNSKVKQALRENAQTEDIAAGLSVSVIKNALFKVLKLKNIQELGDNIVVQGGTFRNASVHRALEQLVGKEVICTDIPELMGAFGAAIVARDMFLEKVKNSEKENKTSFVGIENLNGIDNYSTKTLMCKGCENFCNISRFNFNNNIYYSGNKCEKIFSNKGADYGMGENIFPQKFDLLFSRNTAGKGKAPEKLKKIGIPRVLNMYENFPFWNTLFTECGITVELSSPSTMKISEKGSGTVMSDSICFPAKLVHGHIYDLVEKNIDRIFYPMVMFERNEFADAQNSYNCPIVSSYPEVIKSAVNPLKKLKIPFDMPTITFTNNKLLSKACFDYLKPFGVKKSVFNVAFQKAIEEQVIFKNEIRRLGKEIIDIAMNSNRLLVVLAGRPYHTDPLINQKTPQILSDLGVDVITEDAVPFFSDNSLNKIQVISQWNYPNKIYHAANWVSLQPQNVQFVQFNSFGCGPDAIAVDESVDILKTTSKNHTLIRVDEIVSTGSVKLRLRSLIESLKLNHKGIITNEKPRITTAPFSVTDRGRTILAPIFSDIYSRFLPALFAVEGYKLENLPLPNKESVEFGLKYSNNEICYPATIVVGDIIKALNSGKYNRNNIAIAITQTGGQCRASSYMALIKKAMIATGFDDIPVISINAESSELNTQPGFTVDWIGMLPITFVTVLLGDCLAKMYHATVVREINKGQSIDLMNSYIEKSTSFILQKNTSGLFQLIKESVEKFNQIPVHYQKLPKIGIVGEIYVKHNSFGNHNVVEWLIEQGIEVVVPPLMDFFLQSFVNIGANKKSKLTSAKFSDFFLFFIEKYANIYISRTEKIMKKFRFHSPFHKIRDIARKAENIIGLANQFGEGWLIPAEIASFAEDKINHVVSLQPFGCIANHIISKGVEKRIRDLYPNMNLLFLDFDDGSTEVNLINRLHFMVRSVKETDGVPV